MPTTHPQMSTAWGKPQIPDSQDDQAFPMDQSHSTKSTRQSCVAILKKRQTMSQRADNVQGEADSVQEESDSVNEADHQKAHLPSDDDLDHIEKAANAKAGRASRRSARLVKVSPLTEDHGTASISALTPATSESTKPSSSNRAYKLTKRRRRFRGCGNTADVVDLVSDSEDSTSSHNDPDKENDSRSRYCPLRVSTLAQICNRSHLPHHHPRKTRATSLKI